MINPIEENLMVQELESCLRHVEGIDSISVAVLRVPSVDVHADSVTVLFAPSGAGA
jgi:hypothetical protein